MSYTTEHELVYLIREYLYNGPWDAETRAELRTLAVGILEQLDSADAPEDGPHFIPEDFAS